MARFLHLAFTAAFVAPGIARAQPSDAATSATALDLEPTDRDVSKEAAASDDPQADWKTAPYEHRGGFSVGLALGAGVGASNGFPNDVKKIGRSEFYSESGVGLLTDARLWVGGAPADYLNLGMGADLAQIVTGDTRTEAFAAILHFDLFPLYAFGVEDTRDLGMFFDFGVGTSVTHAADATDDDDALINGGGSSFLSLGVFWEGIRFSKFGMGPYAGVHYMYSESLRQPAALIGFRSALYTLP